VEEIGLTSQAGCTVTEVLKKHQSDEKWDGKMNKPYLVGLTALSDKSRAVCGMGGCNKRAGYNKRRKHE
jgi:hypothetical protein